MRAAGSAMPRRYGADDRIKCPECGAAMQLLRRTPHAARKEYERQTFECSECEHSITRTVDAAGRQLR
jgi:hypothetical protein